jgi:HAD superfamily hydrolase (TIGR01509 family)
MSDSQYSAVIFDFNGVLFWDASLQLQSWQGVAQAMRGYPMSEEEALIHMHGRPNGYVLSYLSGRAITAEELRDLTQRKESVYRELCQSNPAAFVLSPGAEVLLEQFKEHGVPRTIATSSEKTNVAFFREHFELDRWFDMRRIVYDDGRRPGKPAPDMYLAAAESLGLPPRECVVVEDAVSGIQAAQAAGIGYIIGMGATASHPRLMACPGVAIAIESMADFPRDRLRGATA